MDKLEEVVAAHSEAVWRTVYRLLNHYEDARDCYQDTFLAALRMGRDTQVGDWRSMLLTIATRRAVDRLRQRYQWAETADRIEREATNSTWAHASTPAEGDELRDAVRHALAKIPAEQAAAFWLRHWEQMSPTDIARLMNLERGHVRVLVHRAALALRESLGPTYGHTPREEKAP